MIKVGDILEEWDFTVEAGKVREFALAIHDPHWKEGNFAPPTFPVVASACFVERLVTSILDLDRSRTVHGEHQYSYSRPIRVGDRLKCRARLVADETKTGRRGGTMRIVTTEVEFRCADTGVSVCRETMKSVEKAPGSP